MSQTHKYTPPDARIYAPFVLRNVERDKERKVRAEDHEV